jgi:threonine synthase
MLYYSLNNQSAKVSFRDATILGQAPDKGLYFPGTIPVLPGKMISNIRSYSREAIAYEVIRPYVEDSIDDKSLKEIIAETVNFDFPLVEVRDNIYSLELFHGPTLAFKDVGAKFMSGCLGHFVKNSDRKVTVLVATSGDTGGAVANGFYGVESVDVVILYPAGKVSKIQELQLTTLGQNISTLEVHGSFDDCQIMVKEAFADTSLNGQLFLTSANSINVARWLPQQFYYFYAYQQWEEQKSPPVFSVPSGNFGNICAGLLAYHSGLPAAHFIAACNANDVVTRYLQSGNYEPRDSSPTLSNAMDVGNPSNFVRILEMFNNQFHSLKNLLSSYSISDEATSETIREVWHSCGYLLDPHGSVGYLCLEKYLNEHNWQKGIFLETAHPVKFYDVVEPVIGKKVPLPASVKSLLDKKKQSVPMEPSYDELKSYLLSR